MTKLFRLTILMLLITAFSVAVSGCIKKPQPAVNTNQPTNTNVATTTAEIDTSDWKTYRNEEYGFEFKYPGYWVLYTIDDVPPSVSVRVVERGKIGFYVFPLGEYDAGPPPLLDQRTLLVDSKKMNEYDYGHIQILTLVASDEFYSSDFRLELHNDILTPNKSSREFLEILESFKFLR